MREYVEVSALSYHGLRSTTSATICLSFHVSLGFACSVIAYLFVLRSSSDDYHGFENFFKIQAICLTIMRLLLCSYMPKSYSFRRQIFHSIPGPHSSRTFRYQSFAETTRSWFPSGVQFKHPSLHFLWFVAIVINRLSGDSRQFCYSLYGIFRQLSISCCSHCSRCSLAFSSKQKYRG